MEMITDEEQIVLIVKVTNMELIDHHKPNLKGPLRDVIFITFANGGVKTLDLFAETDVTNIDYWEYKKTKKSKFVTIFKHWSVDEIATSED